ncbi:hypothetical protein B7P43_G14368 [Cryptotermes secundus]|uniref:DUF4817 domain-containing protein n=1 Tax=Cryptotermes secundus TaxID=105785 RepID=A0A2J7RD17_9NEOP|nr:hypothetical protein B7P43_G14368 [Cryptotermes secundus]
MEQWNVQERVVAVRAYYRHGDSLVEALREFRRHFNLAPRAHAPSKHAIRTWVQNFEETGSVGKRKSSGRPGSAWTPDNVEAVQASVLRSPHRSVRKVAAAVTVSRRSVQRILHELKFHPYKLQLVQELKPNDHLLRRQFCEAIMNKTDENPDFIENLWMSDEAHFHLNGYVNKQNCRYWAQENPAVLHQRPLHSPKVTVWCAVSARRVIGPYFFEDIARNTVTVTSERYVTMLETFLAARIHSVPNTDIENTWFQQDGATAHTARVSMAAVRHLFGNRVISRNGDIAWPPRSPDLPVCDFHLWGYLKSVVYNTRPTTLAELRRRITEEIAAIQPDTLL